MEMFRQDRIEEREKNELVSSLTKETKKKNKKRG